MCRRMKSEGDTAMSTKAQQREKFDLLIGRYTALLSAEDDPARRTRLCDWIYGASRAAAAMHVITHMEAEELDELAERGRP